MEVTRSLLLGPFYLVKWPVNPNILAASVHWLVRAVYSQEWVIMGVHGALKVFEISHFYPNRQIFVALSILDSLYFSQLSIRNLEYLCGTI